MTILLIGEYSRLHNSLKEGLQALGHQVTLVGNGDGFKQYPVDFSIEARFCKIKMVHYLRQILLKATGFDLQKVEHGIRFFCILNHLKNFDVVQLINEAPIQTTKKWELALLKKVFAQNKKVFLLSSGVDFLNVKFMLENKQKKSILQPFFENPKLKKEFQYVLDYVSKAHKKVHDFVYKNVVGIIASDIDYVLPLVGNSKFLGLVPNPINIDKLEIHTLEIKDKIHIFLGKNQWNVLQKGTSFFEEALSIIENEFGNRVQISITQNIPYREYINLYNNAHILLDQVFAHDQGYNALEAMAKGKVVFTGAEIEFVNFYNLTEKVAINAKPNVASLVHELRFLIQNPNEILKISENAKIFIANNHHHIDVARKYLSIWNLAQKVE